MFAFSSSLWFPRLLLGFYFTVYLLRFLFIHLFAYFFILFSSVTVIPVALNIRDKTIVNCCSIWVSMMAFSADNKCSYKIKYKEWKYVHISNTRGNCWPFSIYKSVREVYMSDKARSLNPLGQSVPQVSPWGKGSYRLSIPSDGL